MLLVDEVDNREYLTGLFEAMDPELPAPKPKKRKIFKYKEQVKIIYC
jgi:hypothetical protein